MQPASVLASEGLILPSIGSGGRVPANRHHLCLSHREGKVCRNHCLLSDADSSQPAADGGSLRIKPRWKKLLSIT